MTQDLEARLRKVADAAKTDLGHVIPLGELLTEAADALQRYREALEQIEMLTTNHGGWFEQDPFGEYCKLGNIARLALNPPEQLK